MAACSSENMGYFNRKVRSEVRRLVEAKTIMNEVSITFPRNLFTSFSCLTFLSESDKNGDTSVFRLQIHLHTHGSWSSGVLAP